MNERVVELADAQATEALGAALAQALGARGAVLHLGGPLGAGKTTLVRGLLRALGHEGRVRSPSYSLLESYRVGGRAVQHLDLYRIQDPAELEFLGLRELLESRALVLIEWAEHGGPEVPAADLRVHLEPRLDGEGQVTGRRARLLACSEIGMSLLGGLGPLTSI